MDGPHGHGIELVTFDYYKHIPYYGPPELDQESKSSSSADSVGMQRDSAAKRGNPPEQQKQLPAMGQTQTLQTPNHNHNQHHQQQQHQHQRYKPRNTHNRPGHYRPRTPPYRERPTWFRTSSPLGHRSSHAQNTQNTHSQQPQSYNPTRPQDQTKYAAGYRDGERDGRRTGLAQGRHESTEQARTKGYRAGHADGFSQGHEQGLEQGHQRGYEKGQGSGYKDGMNVGYDKGIDEGHQEGRQDGFREGYREGLIDARREARAEMSRDTYNTFLDGFEKGYYQGCSDGFHQLYALYPDNIQADHGDPTSPYAGNSVEIYAGCSGDSSLLGVEVDDSATDVDVSVLDIALSDTGTVIYTAQPLSEYEPTASDTATEKTETEAEHITWLTPVSPSAPLVRVASAPDLRELITLARPPSAQGRLHYSEIHTSGEATPDISALIVHEIEAPDESTKTVQSEAVTEVQDAEETAENTPEEPTEMTVEETAESIHVNLANAELQKTPQEVQKVQEVQAGQTGPSEEEESMFMPTYSDNGQDCHPDEPQTPRAHDDNENETSLIKIASPRSASSPTVFSNLFIFPYQRFPVLTYPSPLIHTPTPRDSRDQNQSKDQDADEELPRRSEFIAECYTEFRRKQRHTSYSIYKVHQEKLPDRIGTARAAADAMDEEQSSLSAFPAVFHVSGCLDRQDTPPAAIVPDHTVYKYAVRPYELAKCVHHSLTTCPMCAISPSHQFLGPGESITGDNIFRLDGVKRYAPGGNQETVSDREFSEVKEFTFPVGFGFMRCPNHRDLDDYDKLSLNDLKELEALYAHKGLDVFGQEKALAEIQHPDEADPFRARLFDPRLDEEVLGRFPTDEEVADAAISTDTKDNLPEMHYCLECNGLTWLKTKRTFGYTIQKAEGDDTDKDKDKEAKKKKKGKRAKRDKGKGKQASGETDDAGSETNTTSTKLFEVTLGMQHPSHHASYNEPWSLTQYWVHDNTALIYPEESGTTRTLFVQVAVQDLPQPRSGQFKSTSPSGKMKMLAAYFGPGSAYNSRIRFDPAADTDADGRRLRDLPFEHMNRNAPALAAVAHALYEVWMSVVPAHRAAIDRVTRWNSDHSRRKAYRFRVVVVTPSAYVVDLFATEISDKWERLLLSFDTGLPIKPDLPDGAASAAAPTVPVPTTAVTVAPETTAETTSPNTPAQTTTNEETASAKKRKKTRAKKARERARKAEAKKLVEQAKKAEIEKSQNKMKLVPETAKSKGKMRKKQKQKQKPKSKKGKEKENDKEKEKKDEEDEDGHMAQLRREMAACSIGPLVRDHAKDDGDIDIDRGTAPDSQNPSDAQDEFVYDTSTPSSSSSRSRSRGFAASPARPAQVQDEDESWRVLADMADAVRDFTDFERPGVGRFVYADQRDKKRLLPNGTLVHLIVRYMELLRWHGVHVAFYHAREGTTTAGAQKLSV